MLLSLLHTFLDVAALPSHSSQSLQLNAQVYRVLVMTIPTPIQYARGLSAVLVNDLLAQA